MRFSAVQSTRVQFSVRRMMVGTAVTTILLGGGIVLQKRRTHFRELAEFHTSRAIKSIKWDKTKGYHDATIGREGIFTSHPELDGGHEELAAKYRRAARYPWLPLDDDPVGYPR
jgi:hypothetical protein